MSKEALAKCERCYPRFHAFLKVTYEYHYSSYPVQHSTCLKIGENIPNCRFNHYAPAAALSAYISFICIVFSLLSRTATHCPLISFILFLSRNTPGHPIEHYPRTDILGHPIEHYPRTDILGHPIEHYPRTDILGHPIEHYPRTDILGHPIEHYPRTDILGHPIEHYPRMDI